MLGLKILETKWPLATMVLRVNIRGHLRWLSIERMISNSPLISVMMRISSS